MRLNPCRVAGEIASKREWLSMTPATLVSPWVDCSGDDVNESNPLMSNAVELFMSLAY